MSSCKNVTDTNEPIVRATNLFNRWSSQCTASGLGPVEQARLLIHIMAEALEEAEDNPWARAWKRVAKKWWRYALLLKRDNDSQRAIASQAPYLKERIKELEGQIPARTFDPEDYMIGRG